MGQPNNPILFPLPTDGGHPSTYSELLEQLSCICVGGAQIKPSTPPNATINIGDIIADHAGKLSVLMSAYGIMTAIMQIISCIMDVLCALLNPFSVIFAMIRLFGTCLPNFILVLPQLAIPAFIICLIKIIFAITSYIVNVMIPIMQDIIENIQNLTDAIDEGNNDAKEAVVFKLVSLIKELYNILGIMSALDAILLMVRALIDAGFELPCGGSGGSCDGCGDDQCPDIIQETSFSGTDGALSVFYDSDGIDYYISFSSASRNNDFLTLRDFFPRGFNYDDLDDIDRAPYTLEVGSNTFVIRSVSSVGVLSISQIPNPQLNDGYLSGVYNSSGTITTIDPTNQFVRFGTDTDSFFTSDVGSYLEIFETNTNLDATKNSGTFPITAVYDGYNVKLDHGTGTDFDLDGYATSMNPNAHLIWRKLISAPSTSRGRSFRVDINHAELIRHNMIGLGCHPDIRSTIEGTNNRVPAVSDTTLPDFPDVEGFIDEATACLEQIAPIDVDSDYVLDNYGTMAQATASAAVCITNSLNSLNSVMADYIEEIYPPLFSGENSLLSSDVSTIIVGGIINITITPIDIYGAKLSEGLPTGTIDVKAFTDFGTISSVQEGTDDDGLSSGIFSVTLTSDIIGEANVTASVADTFISDFDETLDPPDLVTRQLELSFTAHPRGSAPGGPSGGAAGTTEGVSDVKSQDSVEPLGSSGKE
jgi:hypothetical protein